MKKIGDKSSILSPITGFRMQNPFRKPSDSNPQGPATISNNLWTKASLRWKGSVKTGSIGLRGENYSLSPNRTINYGKLYVFAYQAKGRLAVNYYAWSMFGVVTLAAYAFHVWHRKLQDGENACRFLRKDDR